MLLATYRPVEVILAQHPLKQLKHELQIHRRCEELPLELLGETAVTEYLAARFPRHSFPATLPDSSIGRRKVTRCLWLPWLDDLLRHGLLRKESETHTWQLKVNARPESAQLCPRACNKSSRVSSSSSPQTERAWLNVASVAGSEFTAFAVAGGGLDQASVEDCCDGLAQRQLLLRNVGLVELTGRFGFRCLSVHPLALPRSSLPPECSQAAKVRFHQRIGQTLEAAVERRSDRDRFRTSAPFSGRRRFCSQL